MDIWTAMINSISLLKLNKLWTGTLLVIKVSDRFMWALFCTMSRQKILLCGFSDSWEVGSSVRISAKAKVSNMSRIEDLREVGSHVQSHFPELGCADCFCGISLVFFSVCRCRFDSNSDDWLALWVNWFY